MIPGRKIRDGGATMSGGTTSRKSEQRPSSKEKGKKEKRKPRKRTTCSTSAAKSPAAYSKVEVARAMELRKQKKKFDVMLRRHVLSEFKINQSIEKTLVESREILPMMFLFERDIKECRDRMKKAVVDVVVRMQKQALHTALKKWKRFLNILDKEEEAERLKLEEMTRQVNGFKTLNRIAKRAMQGKPRVFFTHWKHFVEIEIEKDRKKAARLLQRVVRGHWGRVRARKRARELRNMREKAIRALCSSAYLEKKSQHLAMYRIKVARIKNHRIESARRIQQVYRKYCAVRHLYALRNRKSRDIKRIQAATRIQCLARGFLKRNKVKRKRARRVKRGALLRSTICQREMAIRLIQRVLRGKHGRRIGAWARIEYERLDLACRRVQKAWRVSQGSYALSVKIAARREREKLRVLEIRRNAATKIASVYRMHLGKCLLVRMRYHHEIEQVKRNRAAQMLQIFWWKSQGKHELAMRCATRRYRAELEESSAVCIQRIFRGFACRRRVARKRIRNCAALVIQCTMRCWRARRKLFKLKLAEIIRISKAATVIQCMVRSKLSRDRTSLLRQTIAAVVIQCSARCCIARNVLSKLQEEERERLRIIALKNHGATQVQRIVRGRLARRRVVALRAHIASVNIQAKLCRPYLSRKHFRAVQKLDHKRKTRISSELKCALFERQSKSKVVQRSIRIMQARKVIRRLRHQRRDNAACVIQRTGRTMLARIMMERARRDRAANKVQLFLTHIADRRRLVERFVARRKRMDEELAAAQFMQRVWRAKNGRAKFKKMLQRERNRVMKENYVAERKRKSALELRKMEVVDGLNENRMVKSNEIRQEVHNLVVEKGEKVFEENSFTPPPWAENLPELCRLERTIAIHKRQAAIDNAWIKLPGHAIGVPPEEEYYYYHNEVTQESSWEVPEVILEKEEKAKAELEKQRKLKLKKEKEEAKKNAPPASTLVCKTRIYWVSEFAQCNHPATYYCFHCNEVVCEGCGHRKHSKGVFQNHSMYELESLENAHVCIECQEQLVNKVCQVCRDGFCERCWKRTHGKGVRAKHGFKEIKRYKEPKLEYGDEICPTCDLVAATRKCIHCNDVYCDACYDEMHEKGRRAEHEWEPANEFSVWKQLYDVNTSKYYFYNSFTQQTTWEKPKVLLEKEGASTAGSKPKGRTKSGRLDLRTKRQKQIGRLEKELEELQEWKNDLDAREEAEKATSKPSKFARKSVLQRVRESPVAVLSPFAAKKSYEEEIFYEQKVYLEDILRDNAGEAGVDDLLNGDEMGKKAYKGVMLQKMAEQRKEMRKDLHKQAKAQLSADEFKKRVARCEREFRGVENSKALVGECDKAGLKYGPKHTGPDKLNKAQAIEALVLYRHEKELEKKERLQEQKKQLEEAKAARKRISEMQSKHKVKKRTTFFGRG